MPENPVTTQEASALGIEIYKNHVAHLERLSFSRFDKTLDVDYSGHAKRERGFDERIQKMHERAGMGLVIGKYIVFPVTEGEARYLITKVEENTISVIFIALGKALLAPKVEKNGKIKRSVAEAAMRLQDQFDAPFAAVK